MSSNSGKFKDRRKLDLLHGSIWDKVLLFALPLAATGILQQLFNAADLAVVGRFVGKAAMAAVGSNSPIINLFVNLFVGVSVGANVVIAAAIGRGDPKEVSKAVHTSILAAIIGGFGAMLIGELAAVPIMRLLSVPEEVMPMAEQYLRIYLIGMPVILLYNFEAAVFRSRGDTRTPLIVLTIAGVVNVGLNIFFVCALGMEAEGVALATVISNALSAALLLLRLVRSETEISVRFRELRISGDVLKKILRIGVPTGVQSMVFALSNICVQSAINILGTTVMAASSAALNLEFFTNYIFNSYGQACTTIVGQNYGAGQEARCGKALRTCLGMSMVSVVLFCGLMIIFSRQLLGIFNQDPEVIELGRMRLMYLSLGHCFSLVVDSVSGYLRGHGVSLVPAVISLTTVCGLRVVWIYTVFRVSSTFETLVRVYPLSLGLNAVVVCIAAAIFRARLSRRSGELQEA